MVISPSEGLRNHLVAALEATGYVENTRIIDGYPAEIELLRALRAHATEVIYVDFASSEKALEIITLVEREASHVQVAAFHHRLDHGVLQQVMRAGIREFLTEPFERPAVMESLAQIKSLLDRRPVKYDLAAEVISFLPSKAGVGASTIALNLSAAIARKDATKVLLADFDLNSGMTRFMLKLVNKNSVQDAVGRSDEMDEDLWPQMITQVKGMDVLHAGGVKPNLRIESNQIRNLIAFIRRHYQVLCFDLSGNLEKYSLELMHESRRIMLVCTPEIPSLHLTREKLAFLRECGLADRVSIIVNRMHKKSLFSQHQVEEMIGHPVITTIPNDYHSVHHATADATVLDPASLSGKSIAAFAETLWSEQQLLPRTDKRNFLEQFFMPAQKIAHLSGQN
jgi:pilus assembly protein CpaE